jgi:hypothetical protein
MRRLLFAPVLAAVAIATTLAQAPAAGPEQTLMDIERRWVAAALKNDVAGLDAILAPNWTGVSPDGVIVSRVAALENVKKVKLTRSEVSDMNVKLIGTVGAVVTGVYTAAGLDETGTKIDKPERWTDVFVNQGGQWKCIASHNTTITK